MEPIAESDELDYGDDGEISAQTARALDRIEDDKGENRTQNDIDRGHQEEQILSACQQAKRAGIPDTENKQRGDAGDAGRDQKVDNGSGRATTQTRALRHGAEV
ncbi:MAG: hypothetical protein M3Y55_02310 [Pseudomonadota bacterium]|nr:hypothetical protein [Pseudomonadota bacterium]